MLHIINIQNDTEDCPPPYCIWVPTTNSCFNRSFLVPMDGQLDDGQHEHDYYFLIRVQNNALLETTVTYKVQII